MPDRYSFDIDKAGEMKYGSVPDSRTGDMKTPRANAFWKDVLGRLPHYGNAVGTQTGSCFLAAP